jgi:hypothetical protein
LHTINQKKDMKKLNKEQQTKVEAAREAVIKLQEAQELIYSELTDEIGWDNDWLYDYIFNCSSEDEYTTKVRREIFE